MVKRTPVAVPEHLTGDAAAFWRRVQADYAIDDAAGLRLLTLAAEALMAAEAARVAIAEHGQTYIDRFGAPRPRPEVSIQRNAMVTFARLTREMGLQLEDGK